MEFTSLIGLLAGCGILAGIAYWWSSRSGKKSDARKGASEILQKVGLKKIKETEEKQKVVVAEIEKNEKLSMESKEKIKNIQKEAAKEIGAILKEERIANIDKEIDETWDEL